ncbi:MAG: hypothetical protein AAF416_11270 [Pseudomonadota bacterium]
MRVPGRRVTRILWLFQSMRAGPVRFEARMLDGGPVIGDVIVKTRRMGNRGEEHLPLLGENVLHKDRRDTDFSVYVRPEGDCEIDLDGRFVTVEGIFAVLGGAVMLVAFVLTMIQLFSG